MSGEHYYDNVKGIIRGSDGAPAKRKIQFYDKATGELVKTIYSAEITGEFSTYLPPNKPHYYIAKADPVTDRGCEDVFVDNIVPTIPDFGAGNGTPINHIGVPGEWGFGVGICPFEHLPADMQPLEGFNVNTHPNYGNYRVIKDDSIMVWIPRFYFKWGTGTNGIPINDVEVVPHQAYETPEAAAADGWVLPRAFIDGGKVQPGFFIDKYINTFNDDARCLSSHFRKRIFSFDHVSTSYRDQFPDDIFTKFEFKNYTNEQLNTPLCLTDMIKERGEDFSLPSTFMFMALFILSRCHMLKTTDNKKCEYKEVGPHNTSQCSYSRNVESNSKYQIYFYNSNMNSADQYFSSHMFNDNLQRHNGQACGMNYVESCRYTCFGVVRNPNNTNLYILKESSKLKDLNFVKNKSKYMDFSENGFWEDSGNKTDEYIYMYGSWYYNDNKKPMFDSITDRTDLRYKAFNCGIPKTDRYSTSHNLSMAASMISLYNNSMLCVGNSYDDGRFSLTISYASSKNRKIGVSAARYVL